MHLPVQPPPAEGVKCISPSNGHEASASRIRFHSKGHALSNEITYRFPVSNRLPRALTINEDTTIASAGSNGKTVMGDAATNEFPVADKNNVPTWDYDDLPFNDF